MPTRPSFALESGAGAARNLFYGLPKEHTSFFARPARVQKNRAALKISCHPVEVLLGYQLARAIGSGVEHFLHTEGVAGSNPASPTSGDIAQLGERVTGSHEVRGSNPLISTM